MSISPEAHGPRAFRRWQASWEFEQHVVWEGGGLKNWWGEQCGIGRESRQIRVAAISGTASADVVLCRQSRRLVEWALEQSVVRHIIVLVTCITHLEYH